MLASTASLFWSVHERSSLPALLVPSYLDRLLILNRIQQLAQPLHNIAQDTQNLLCWRQALIYCETFVRTMVFSVTRL